jgi:hypothetical protein
MTRDPIIDELRAIRDEIAREHNYDFDSLFQMLREAEAKSERVHVSPPPPDVAPLSNATNPSAAAVEAPPRR